MTLFQIWEELYKRKYRYVKSDPKTNFRQLIKDEKKFLRNFSITNPRTIPKRILHVTSQFRFHLNYYKELRQHFANPSEFYSFGPTDVDFRNWNAVINGPVSQFNN